MNFRFNRSKRVYEKLNRLLNLFLATRFQPKRCDRKWTIRMPRILLCRVHGVAMRGRLRRACTSFERLCRRARSEKEPKRAEKREGREEKTEMHSPSVRQLSDLIPRKGFRSWWQGGRRFQRTSHWPDALWETRLCSISEEKSGLLFVGVKNLGTTHHVVFSISVG